MQDTGGIAGKLPPFLHRLEQTSTPEGQTNKTIGPIRRMLLLLLCPWRGCRERKAPMTRSFNDERDYPFGQAMLTLRTNLGLTQSGLADLLGVSRRAVGEW